MYRVVLGYFLLVAGLTAFFVFPQLRIAVAQASLKIFHRSACSSQRALKFLKRVTFLSMTAVRRAFDAFWHTLRERRALLTVALIVVATPPLLALFLHKGTLFEFAEHARTVDPRIAMLLEGERLSPPPTLAPTIFTTREVELARPEAVWASRDWELLEPAFRQRLLLVMKLMREQHGYDVVLLEGYRSPDRQARLAARGGHVTRAGAYQSYHQYGLAADCAFLRNGKLVITEQDPWAMTGYRLFGELAESVGLTWGGRWTLRDFGHVELSRPEVLVAKR